jgi:hypothetical protein
MTRSVSTKVIVTSLEKSLAAVACALPVHSSVAAAAHKTAAGIFTGEASETRE